LALFLGKKFYNIWHLIDGFIVVVVVVVVVVVATVVE
jgi:hypothetical protein